MAMMNLIHFGTAGEFRIQKPEESQMNSNAEAQSARRSAEKQMILLCETLRPLRLRVECGLET
jgi:CHAT domain-containing protein